MTSRRRPTRVVGFTLMREYGLLVRFDDESARHIDFEPVFHGAMWGPLRDPALFNQVSIDPIAHTLSWPNGPDFDPETLRNWPEYQGELAAKATGWLEVEFNG